MNRVAVEGTWAQHDHDGAACPACHPGLYTIHAKHRRPAVVHSICYCRGVNYPHILKAAPGCRGKVK